MVVNEIVRHLFRRVNLRIRKNVWLDFCSKEFGNYKLVADETAKKVLNKTCREFVDSKTFNRERSNVLLGMCLQNAKEIKDPKIANICLVLISCKHLDFF